MPGKSDYNREPTTIQIVAFSAGLVSDVNDLAFPDNASKDEKNLELGFNNTRYRRLGFDLLSTTSLNTGIFF